MGEATFRRADILFADGKPDQAEQIIEEVVNNPGSDYWLAQSFILWAKIFHQRGNDVQARQTLQSIIDNYEVENDADDEVINEARTLLSSINTPKTDNIMSTDDNNSEGDTIIIDNEN
jgi:hypothetical protein